MEAHTADIRMKPTREEALAIAARRKAARRARTSRLRRWIAVVSVIAFIGPFGVIYAQIASGRDPALAGTQAVATAAAAKTSTAATGSTSTGSTSDNSGSTSSSDNSGSTSTTTTTTSQTPAAVTTSQS